MPMVTRMRLRLTLVLGPALALAVVDLAVKASVTTPLRDFHERSAVWAASSAALLLGAVVLTYVPSRAVALAAGVTGGGVLGNLVSAAWYHGLVPNPLLVGSERNGIAFNLADVFVLCGILLLMGSLVRASIRNRDRLIPPRRWERALRRRFGG
jgi:Signal peptidase (SPase) II